MKMNNQRRKALTSLHNDLDKVKGLLEEELISNEQIEELKGKLADVQSQLETIRDEEQDYFDNMPEGLQAGEKGDKATEAIDNIDSAINETEVAQDSLEEAKPLNEEDRSGAIEAACDEIDNAMSSIDSATE
jgi:DNA repair exonuclease SbcCD ATPase subunit